MSKLSSVPPFFTLGVCGVIAMLLLCVAQGSVSRNLRLSAIESAKSDIHSDLQQLNMIDGRYIGGSLDACLEGGSAFFRSTDFFGAFYQFFSDDGVDNLSHEMKDYCIEKFALSANSMSDLYERNAKLRAVGLSPFSTEADLAQAASVVF